MKAPPSRVCLVIEAHPIVRIGIRSLLAPDWDTEELDNGAEALELYEEHHPDLLTLDLVMPRMTGVEALGALRERHPDARVVVCSSLSDQGTIFEAIRLGARDYVLKPVSADKLLDAARKAVSADGKGAG